MRSMDVQICPALMNALPDNGLGGCLRVDIGIDDDRILPAELEDRPVQQLPGGGPDLASSHHGAGEMHQWDLFVSS